MTVEVEVNSSWVDITKYIKFEGLDFGRHDVEAPDAGRDMAGDMHRGRVAIKERVDLQTVPIDNTGTALLHGYIRPESVRFRITPYPSTNAAMIMNVYSNEVKTHYLIHRADGRDIYTMTFPLVEM